MHSAVSGAEAHPPPRPSVRQLRTMGMALIVMCHCPSVRHSTQESQQHGCNSSVESITLFK